ncbi:ribbon-helix-helix domain-containing protein [Veillonella sp.]|uniref:ribbon-helix-helix domain-containing protein n=1 Tax=Veillonella sp. TaxID=1926307 RepID=UPI0025FFC7E2|nr:ribbon-helix-helix domain-containing protein [Veillonella sp.]
MAKVKKVKEIANFYEQEDILNNPEVNEFIQKGNPIEQVNSVEEQGSKKFSITLSVNTVKKLEKLAKSMHLTRAALVRILVEEYLEQKGL